MFCDILQGMIQTFLITGSSKEERMKHIQTQCNAWDVQSFDISTLTKKKEDTESIGISDVRDWQKTLAFSPHHGAYTVGIIPDAHLLTIEAQHALLKTLEEPPEHVRIFCETDHIDILLPTILSRVTINIIKTQDTIDVPTTNIAPWFSTWKTMKYGDVIGFVDTTWKEKTDAQKNLIQLLLMFHEALTKTKKPNHATPLFQWDTHALIECIRSVQTAQSKIQANVQYKLAMDDVLFTILSLQPKD